MSSSRCWGCGRYDHVRPELDQFLNQNRQALILPFRFAFFDHEVLIFDIAQLLQLLSKYVEQLCSGAPASTSQFAIFSPAERERQAATLPRRLETR